MSALEKITCASYIQHIINSKAHFFFIIIKMHLKYFQIMHTKVCIVTFESLLS